MKRATSLNTRSTPGESVSLACTRFGSTWFTTPIVLVHGGSDRSWNGVPLPLQLTALGRPDCALLVAPDVTVGALARHGSSWRLAVPNDLALVGSAHHFQVLGAPPGGALFTSNGVTLVVGLR
ncbi:MAG: hypothetical protein IPM29_17865 [Planctomycetes bacterium]|nr:hypothetical protein [Planctomycetota bacterium]